MSPEVNSADFLKQWDVDVATSLEILNTLNGGQFRSEWPVVAGLPDVDGISVVDSSQVSDSIIEKGWLGLSKTALGILNGGSATSYVDRKKNLSIHPLLSEIYAADIERAAEELGGRPKALAPAFYQPDGQPGPSFLELKVRHLLLLSHVLSVRQLPLFQMTSPATHQALIQAWEKLCQSPWVKDLIGNGVELPQLLTRQQELITAFTLPDAQGRRNVFVYGDPPRPLLLPGGHGQNFRVLADVYSQLTRQGYDWGYLTNVDNLGALPSVSGLGLVIDRQAQAGFDFSFKTAIDVKGGILFRDNQGRLQCADLGVGVDPAVLKRYPEARILFNCATGVFHLPTLVEKLPRIVQHLPLRLSNQDKDLGHYTQAEQVTWEVIGLLDRPLILGVEKQKRFLAAKMVIDTFLTSALKLDHPLFQSPELENYRVLAHQLHEGLSYLLRGPYALKQEGGIWVPLTFTEIQNRLKVEGWRWASPF